jgi:hypothetical protein
MACAVGAASLNAQSAPVLGAAPTAPAKSAAASRASKTRASADIAASVGGLSIDPSRREGARIAFNTLYQASEGVPSNWTGDVAQGNPGATSQPFRDAIALRVNYFRAMAGVPAGIAFSDVYNFKDQQAALMMSANNQITHTPPASWVDYTADGAEAARNSSLALGVNGPSAITAYIQDDGPDNAPVGHRRWMLYPQTKTMGSGDVDGSAYNNVPGFSAANSLWSIDGNYDAARPATRESFVAWPPPGYVPYPLIFNRWSFAYPKADFSQATVTMQRNGAAVPVRLEPLAADYGENTLTWVSDNAVVPSAQDVTTSVTVSNVKIGGASRTFTYNVTAFDPLVPGVDTITPVIGGLDVIPLGAPILFNFNAVPGADGYQWQVSAYSSLSLHADAEGGPGDVTASPAGANPVTTAFQANGAASYQLTSQPATTLQLNPVIVPGPDSALQFNSRLGYATALETARAQISADGGVTWQDLFSRAGPVSPSPDAAFASVSIPLDDYAGKPCLIRFTFSNSGTYYIASSSVGWFIDDIAVTNAGRIDAVSAPADLPAGSQSFAFTPPQPGVYALQVTPVFYGKYVDPNTAGPLKLVAAGADAPPLLPLPVITSGTTASGWVDMAFTYHVSATNNPTAFAADSLPPGLFLDAVTGIISGIPTTPGEYRTILYATNASGVTSAALTLTMAVLPKPPVIGSPSTAAGKVGAQFAFQISAANEPTHFAAAGLPDGLNVDPQTGLITGAPAMEGEYAVTVGAMNAVGGAMSTLSLQISPLIPTLTLSASVPDVKAASGQTGEFTITRTGDDLSKDVLVSYEIKGSAVGGTDYQPLKGWKKIKAGRASARVLIAPLGKRGDGKAKKAVKLVLLPDPAYELSEALTAKVKIWR